MADFNLPFGVRVADGVPVDADRYLAVDIAARDSLVSSGREFIGLQVFVESDETLYILKTGNVWEAVGAGGGDTIFTGGTMDQSSTILGATNDLFLGTDISPLSDFGIEIIRNHVSPPGDTIIRASTTSGVNGGWRFQANNQQGNVSTMRIGAKVVEIQQAVTDFGNPNFGDFYVYGTSDVNRGNKMEAFNFLSSGNTVNIITGMGGISLKDSVNNTWAVYDVDYSTLGLLNDLSIPSVGGVKSLIDSEGFYGTDGTLGGNRIVEGGFNSITFQGLSEFLASSESGTVFRSVGTFVGSSSEVSLLGANILFRSFSAPSLGGNKTELRADASLGTGFILSDYAGLGLNYDNRIVDEFNITWATDDNHIPSIGMIKTNTSGSSQTFAISSVILATRTDNLVLATVGGITLTLPAAPTDLTKFTIKDANGLSTATPITVDVSGGGTIDGQLTLVINNDRDSYTVQYSGGTYYIIGKY